MTNLINEKCICGNEKFDVLYKHLIETQKLILNSDHSVKTPRKTKFVIVAKCTKCNQQIELEENNKKCQEFFKTKNN